MSSSLAVEQSRITAHWIPPHQLMCGVALDTDAMVFQQYHFAKRISLNYVKHNITQTKF